MQVGFAWLLLEAIAAAHPLLVYSNIKVYHSCNKYLWFNDNFGFFLALLLLVILHSRAGCRRANNQAYGPTSKPVPQQFPLKCISAWLTPNSNIWPRQTINIHLFYTRRHLNYAYDDPWVLVLRLCRFLTKAVLRGHAQNISIHVMRILGAAFAVEQRCLS